MSNSCYNVAQEKARAVLQTPASVAESVTRLKENESDMAQPIISLSASHGESLQRQVLNSKLGRSEKYVLLAISFYVVDGKASVGHEFLEYVTNCERHVVSRAIKKLAARGVLEITERGFDGLNFTPASYKINAEQLERLPPYDVSHSRLVNPIRTRRELIKKHDGICFYCKRKGANAFDDPDGKSWTVDRIIPRAEGGKYEEGNMVLACYSCNRRKKDKRAVAE